MIKESSPHCQANNEGISDINDVCGNKRFVGRFGCPTVYKDIIINWDEDLDTRILDFVDSLPEWLSKHILSLSEYKGTIEVVIKPSDDEYFTYCLLNTFNLGEYEEPEWNCNWAIHAIVGGGVR